MNKWIAISVIAVLAVGVIVVGYLFLQETNKLREAQSEIVVLERNVATLEGDVATLEGNVTTLEGNISTLEGNVTTLETDLAESEAIVSTLEADLENAQNALRAQQNINLALSEELKTVTYPRHFASVAELVDWLHKDDTDIKFAGERYCLQAFILQVRALRDGYLLPASLWVENGILWVRSVAVIGDSVYGVWAGDDSVGWLAYIAPLPSHPLSPD